MSASSTLDQIAAASQVLILGFAREGQSTYKFLRSRYPNLKIDLADQKSPEHTPVSAVTETFFGPDYLAALTRNHYPVVIKTPGISPYKPEIESAKAAGTVFTSQTQIFFEICPARIIGITGTKGKSTTASLLHHVLHENGLPSVLVGNIGQPALDYLPEITPLTWVVMELSSYQLMDVTRSPHIAVLQNIVPDHLDYHKDFEEYLAAKQNLVRFQSDSDYFLYNADFPLPAQTASLTPAQKIPYSLKNFDPDIKSSLLGNHNKYNIFPSVIVGLLLGIRPEKVYSAIASYIPLETRLQKVATTAGIEFYEDTLATIPEATIAALEALHPRVDTLIVGGFERKQNYLDLSRKILETGINNLILFPATGSRIWSEINRIAPAHKIRHYPADSMAQAVRFALDHTASGKICLLSPAAPSFTLFKDYRDESAQYRKYIHELGEPSQS